MLAGKKPLRLLVLFLGLLTAFIIIRRAWLCDDAYITFRVVDNFIHGYGLVWNVGERVQVFTHPLWFFLLSLGYFISRDFYWMPLFLGVGLACLAFILMVRCLSRSNKGSILALLFLLLSKAFIDYSTSGLENPLSYLLIVLFFIQFFSGEPTPRWLGRLSLLAALGLLNRMDLVLVFGPALCYGLWKLKIKKGLVPLLLGQIPFILWELFALWYYGFPFPNPYYAKLYTGIDSAAYLHQGLLYLLYSLQYDPVTILGILSGAVVNAIAAVRNKILANRSWLPVLGGFLYVAYVVKIGGDFMDGRFLTVPLLCSLIGLVQAIGPEPQVEAGLPAGAELRAGLFSTGRTLAFVSAALILIGLLIPVENTFSTGSLSYDDRRFNFINGIANERGFYIPGTSILNYRPGSPYPNFPWILDGMEARAAGQKVVVKKSIGMFGLYAGPDVYIVDLNAISDLLLARLPIRQDIPWRIGHFERALPAGYPETLETGRNLIADPNLKKYYAALMVAARGNLWDGARLVTILELNLGLLNPEVTSQ